MLQQASSTDEQGQYEPIKSSIEVGPHLRRPSLTNFRPRSSPLKFFASTAASKPEVQRETQKAWEKEYLNDLRLNRPTRPSGARPAPHTWQDPNRYPLETASRISSTLPPDPLLPARQTSPSRISEQEQCSSPRSDPQEASLASAPSNHNPIHDTVAPSQPRCQPSGQAPPASATSRVISSHTRTSSGLYRERAQRLAEKEEARMLREALEAVDLQEEARLRSAAQDEASELVWQHQNPSMSQKIADAPYSYEQQSGGANHVRSQSDQPLGTNINPTRDVTWPRRSANQDFDRVESERVASTSSSVNGHDRALSCPPRSEEARRHSAAQMVPEKAEELLDECRNQHTKGHHSWDSPHKKAYMNLTFTLPPLKPSGQRRSSGTKARNPSGSLFRNPDDKIYEEPEELKHETNSRKAVDNIESTPLRSTTRNPFANMHTASQPSLRSMTDPMESKSRPSQTDIHRSVQSQSRNPTYMQNKPPISFKERIGDGPGSTKFGTKHGIELRSDEMRAATSMRLRDRSPKLHSPTVVSNAKGRPIVSFDKDWTLSKGDLKRQEPFPQRPTDNDYRPQLSATVRSKPLLEHLTTSAPIVPTINTPEPPTIQVDEAPTIPSINISAAPCISTSTADTTDTLSSKPAKPLRPLPKPAMKSIPRPSDRLLPHHSSTAPVRSSFPHWSPSQRRATAQCAACALPISGRICTEQLECVAFYPEPDNFRDERVARIRDRSQGTEIANEAGKTWEEDGDEGLRFYCHLDFHEKFSPRCRSCKTPIEGEVVVACGGEWHVGHFFCAQCGDPFDQKTPFVEKDGYAWCTSPSGEDERIFSAHIPALERITPSKETYTPPVVLVAERNGKSMYAIERVHCGIYAQCKLGSWVTIEHLQRLPRLGTTTAAPIQGLCLQEAENWWRPIIANKKLKPSIADQAQTSMPSENALLNLDTPDYVSIKSVGSPRAASPAEPTEAVAVNMMDIANISQPEAPQLPENYPLHDLDALLNSIRILYMESLYRSKVPLAYFAKGPLSRARAAVSDTENLATSQCRLTDYLQDLVVPLNLLDKKYRDTVPALLMEFPKMILSEDERTEVVAKYQKNHRRSTKGKIRKNGLCPQEDVDVLQWWLDCKDYLSDCETPELKAETITSLVFEQRTRETKLQIILILEIMALEKTQSLPAVQLVTEAEGHDAVVPQRKRGKGQGLDLLLDLSLDRLCIWQSMTTEDNISRDAREAGPRLGETSNGKMQDFNHLHEFCVDVVMPFFTARLPDVSKTLCKKLGGPLPLSPTRPTPKRTASGIAKPTKPGAAVKRPPPPQARRTLERVLTEDRTSRKTTPTLCRSATDSAIPKVKREPSEASLSAVPHDKSTLHKSKRYKQREVDLTAASQAAEAKMRKKANIEQELKGAIAALKKPNPRMAVKELVEAAEQRADRAKTKKSADPRSTRLAQSVQIMSTPAANRRKNVFASQTLQEQNAKLFPAGLDEIPSSGCAHVPVSAIKPMAEVVLDSDPTHRKRFVPTVEQTPTRGPFRHSDINARVTSRPGLADTDNVPSKQPLQTASMLALNASNAPQLRIRVSNVQSTPSKRVPTGVNSTLSTSGAEATPSKPLKSMSGNLDAPRDVTTSFSSYEEGLSIYKSLGWDDDVDDLM
ncbi:MAG: hypothetical protein Q9202_001395 [Teloschistes flavicans]